MRVQDLADVHARWHADRIQDDLHGAPVGQERHVLNRQDLGDDALVAVAAGHLVALGDLSLLGDRHTHLTVDAGRQLRASLALERADVHDLAAFAVWHPEGRVLDLARLLAEDRPQQALLGCQLGLTLRRDLADQDVASLDLAPTRMMPFSSRSRRLSSPTLGMSRVISSGPSLVSRASTSCFSMWMEVNLSSRTIDSLIRMASSKLPPSQHMNATSTF